MKEEQQRRRVCNVRHGKSGTRVYKAWLSVLDRCDNDRSGNYGARGISVCDRWRVFEAFYADMGEPPSDGHSLDRIDNDGNYEPSNCRWATRSQQGRNKRSNTLLTQDGQTRPLVEWAEMAGLKESTICHRLKHGWSVERAVTEPVARVPIDWDSQPLGQESDARIARRLGVSTQAAWTARTRRGIAPFQAWRSR